LPGAGLVAVPIEVAGVASDVVAATTVAVAETAALFRVAVTCAVLGAVGVTVLG
jgi:hypothetical protein